MTWSLGAFVLKIGLRQPQALGLSGWWEARVAVPKATTGLSHLGFFRPRGPWRATFEPFPKGPVSPWLGDVFGVTCPPPSLWQAVVGGDRLVLSAHMVPKALGQTADGDRGWKPPTGAPRGFPGLCLA